MNQTYFELNPCYDSNSFGFDQPPQYSIDHQPPIIQQDLNLKLISDELMIEQRNELLKTLQSSYSICFDDDDVDDKEITIPLCDIISQLPPSIVITTLLLFYQLKIPSESEDTFESDSEYVLPSCNDVSPIDVPEEKPVTFSNHLFNLNDDFISSNDESLSYISSDVNPLFDEMLENIEIKDSYDSNLDEPNLLVTPLSDANKDECFDSGGDVAKINDFEDGYYDSKGDIFYLESLLSDDTTPNLHHE
nr:hypothetical protein [Tanacetum cinerariifolium]